MRCGIQIQMGWDVVFSEVQFREAGPIPLSGRGFHRVFTI